MKTSTLCQLSASLATIYSVAHALPATLSGPSIEVEKARALEQRATETVSAAGSVVTLASAGTYPRANSVTYANGSTAIIAGYTGTTDDGADKILQVAQSTDGGGSWALIGSVAQGPVATQEIDNPFPLQIVPGGRILYAFRNHDIDASTGDYTYYRITVSYSDDFGENWLFLSQVNERAATATNNGLWEPFLRLANDGTTIQCYYSSEDAADDQNSFMKYSTDGGATWSDEIYVSGQDVTSRDGMTGVAVVSGDTLICVFENTEDGPFSIRYVLSYDDGMTWDPSTRNILYDPTDSVSTAQAPSVVNVGGLLVAGFMTNEDTPSDTDGDADGGTFKVVTASSSDVTTWGDKTSISTGAHWPGLYDLSSTNFLALYGQDTVGVATRDYSV